MGDTGPADSGPIGGLPDEPVMVDLIGLHGGQWFGRPAGAALQAATVVVGAARHLDAVPVPAGAQRLEMTGDLGRLLERVGELRSGGARVCLLASGDPGFFGLTRLARARLGPDAVRVHPAPSSVSLAFARIAEQWDDAVVVSAHGRSPDAALDAVRRYEKVAVLCSPTTPPEALGQALAGPGAPARRVTVASRLGHPDEVLWEGDPAALAAGTFDPVSVVVFRTRPASEAGWSWGLPEAGYRHRDGMITKAEVRAVALGKLAVPPTGVMWDVGAGSGSVSAECARLVPALRIFAVERNRADVPMLRENLHGTAVTVVEGSAPEALAGLPDPDRAFVGGGGLDVLDAVLDRLRPGGAVVATYAAPARAVDAAARLGHMVQVSVSRAVPAGEGGALRLAAENPVFVCWGPI